MDFFFHKIRNNNIVVPIGVNKSETIKSVILSFLCIKICVSKIHIIIYKKKLILSCTQHKFTKQQNSQ